MIRRGLLPDLPQPAAALARHRVLVGGIVRGSLTIISGEHEEPALAADGQRHLGYEPLSADADRTQIPDSQTRVRPAIAPGTLTRAAAGPHRPGAPEGPVTPALEAAARATSLDRRAHV